MASGSKGWSGYGREGGNEDEGWKQWQQWEEEEEDSPRRKTQRPNPGNAGQGSHTKTHGTRSHQEREEIRRPLREKLKALQSRYDRLEQDNKNLEQVLDRACNRGAA